MKLQFGEFTLDTDTRQLLHGGAEVHLSPKAFDLLSALLQNRPRALSKSELQEILWPATFVAESNLSSLITELRHALGDTARQMRFIRTVHRFGYAFASTATEIREADATIGRPVGCWITWGDGQAALSAGANLVGRDRDVAVWLDSPTVSRHHARITIAGTEATIEDLGSKNGTFLRGIRITNRLRLSDGDAIRIGSVDVVFRMASVASSTKSVAPDQ
jgi:DNA-binding winged helix-turn-helix (wHTH) protein